MPAGANKKREREYKELKGKFKKSGRYHGREEEVAARIVNKQRKQYGETKAARSKKKRGENPDKNLPIPDYQHLTVPQIKNKLPSLSRQALAEVRNYEASHKSRKTLLEALA